MVIYPIAASAITMTPIGNGNVVGNVIDVVYNGVTYSCPFRVEGQTSATKGGTQRVMIKATITTPTFQYTDGSTAATALIQSGTDDVTLHCVLTVPSRCKIASTSATLQGGLQAIIRTLAGSLVATMTGNRSAATSSAPTEGCLWRGLRGFYPLDSVEGDYGAHTA